MSSSTTSFTNAKELTIFISCIEKKIKKGDVGCGKILPYLNNFPVPCESLLNLVDKICGNGSKSCRYVFDNIKNECNGAGYFLRSQSLPFGIVSTYHSNQSQIYQQYNNLVNRPIICSRNNLPISAQPYQQMMNYSYPTLGQNRFSDNTTQEDKNHYSK